MEPEQVGAQMQTRRDFARRIGTALGGVALLGRGRNAFGQIPSGYTFYRVLTASDGQKYNGLTNIVGDLTAAVMMGTTQEVGKPPLGYVYFHGTGTSQSYLGANAAAFIINLDYSVTPPKVTFLNSLAYETQVLPVGDTHITVGQLGTGASNSAGTYATTIEVADTSGTVAVANTPGVYTWNPDFGTWTKLAGFGDPSADGGYYGANFGDLSIDDSGNVTFSGATTMNPPNEPSYVGSDTLSVTSPSELQSSRSVRSGRGRLLLATGQNLPGTSTIIRALGLVDVSSDGWFVAQTSSNHPVASRDVRTRERRLGTALVRGRMGHPNSLECLAISPHLVEGGILPRASRGEIVLGPRIGAGGVAVYGLHSSSARRSAGYQADHQLIFDNPRTRRKEVIAATGRLPQRQHAANLGSRGSVNALSSDETSVNALSSAVIGASNLVYYTQNLSDGSTQLIITDPSSSVSQILLQSGDTVADGAQITEILFGYHPTQIDSQGRLAFAAEFLKNPNGDPNDSNNIESSIVIGIPS